MPLKAPWACKCGKRIAAGQPCPVCTAPRKRVHDAKRLGARVRVYDTKWDRERAAYLAAHPWCVRCAAHGLKAKATVVNHKIAHRGDLRLFWNRRNWEPVCAACHNGSIQSAEKRGDPQARRFGYSIPFGVQPSISPVTLVCGPPASGKTSYVKARALPGDTIIDLNQCLVEAGGKPWDNDRTILGRAFSIRDGLIHSLATTRTRMAWLIASAPSHDERRQWQAALGNVQVVVMNTPASVCIERIRTDPARAHAAPRLIERVNEWMGRGRSIAGDPAGDRRGERNSQQIGIEGFFV